MDEQAALVPEFLALGGGLAEDRVLLDHVADVVAEEAHARVGGDAAVLRRLVVQGDRPGLGLLGLLRGEVPVLDHLVDDDVAALARGLGVGLGVELGGVLHQSGQGGGLGDGEVLAVLAEVALGRRLDPVRLLAVVRDVQVVGEYLVLGQLLLQLDGVLELLDLAAEGLALGLQHRHRVVAGLLDVHVLHVLLGERGRALDGGAALRVLGDGPQDALEVDRSVLVEARVLDVHLGLAYQRAHLLAGDHPAVALVHLGYLLALGVVDPTGLGQRRGLQVGGDAVELLDAALHAEPQRSGGREGDAREQDAREGAVTEELHAVAEQAERGLAAPGARDPGVVGLRGGHAAASP